MKGSVFFHHEDTKKDKIKFTKQSFVVLGLVFLRVFVVKTPDRVPQTLLFPIPLPSHFLPMTDIIAMGQVLPANSGQP